MTDFIIRINDDERNAICAGLRLVQHTRDTLFVGELADITLANDEIDDLCERLLRLGEDG